MEYVQYTVGYLRSSNNTEYRIRVYANSELQAIRIVRTKLLKFGEEFGEGKYYIVED